MPPHARHTLITELRFDVQRKYGPAERRAFLDAFDARMRADSRVRGIAYTTSGPFSSGSVRVWRSGDPPDAGQVRRRRQRRGRLFRHRQVCACFVDGH